MVAAGVPGAGSKRSFAAFVATSADGLRREVRADVRRRGLPVDVDVDDVVQTAYVKLLPVYERLDTEYAAFNYAHKTALRALDDLRKRDRVRHEGWLESVYRRHHRHVADPEEEALRGLRAADVRQAFGRLPLSQRRAVALVDLEEMRQAEAADVLGVSPTVLKGLVQRGRERLRRDLVTAPTLLALFRFRRRALLAPIAGAPAATVMAALLLTVAQLPGTPDASPYVSGSPGGPLGPAIVRVAAAPAGPLAARATTPKRVVAPPVTRKAPPRYQVEPYRPTEKQLPKAPGACIASLCMFGDDGDEMCVRHEATQGRVCFSQTAVPTCSSLVPPAEPVTSCTERPRAAAPPTTQDKEL